MLYFFLNDEGNSHVGLEGVYDNILQIILERPYVTNSIDKMLTIIEFVIF